MAEGYEPQPVPTSLIFSPSTITLESGFQSKVEIISKFSTVGTTGYYYTLNLTLQVISAISATTYPYGTKLCTVVPSAKSDISGMILDNNGYDMYGYFILTQANNLWCSITKNIPSNTKIILQANGIKK